MANTRIAIKRSATNSTIPALFQGELVYSQNGVVSTTNSGLLFIGQPSDNAAIAIGGKYYFGTLTACQALVTNSTSWLDVGKFNNVVTNYVYANGASGGAGQALFSNSTGGIFWQAPAGSGTVTNVAPANGIMTSPNPIVGAGNVYVVAGSGCIVNSTGVCANLAASPGLAFTSGGLGVSPGPSIAVAATTTVNLAATSGLAIASGLAVVAGQGLIINSTGTHANIGGSLVFTSGALGVNAAATSSLVANATGLWVLVGNGHTVNSTGYFAVNSSPAISVNTTGTFVNLASSPGLVTASGLAVSPGPSIAVGATTVVNLASSPGLVIASGLAVSPGPSIAVGATTTVNLAATSGLGIASGLTVTAGQGLIINSTGTHANLAASPGLAFTSGGLGVSPGSAIAVGATTQVNLQATSGLTTAGGLAVVTNTSQFVVAAGGITCNSTGVLTIQDLTCQGNLTVSGTAMVVNSTTLAVNDNLIALSYNQAATTTFNDLVDSGFYITTGNTLNSYYSGIARIKNSSTNTNPLFQLFSYTGTAPNTTVLPAVTTGTLQSFLTPWGAGGAMVVNSSSITLTCNSTVGVALTANSLSLTTQLAVSNIAAGTDGYVLQTATGTGAAYYGTLDGGTF